MEKSGKFQANKDGHVLLHHACHISTDIYCMVWGLVYLFAGIPEPLHR